MLVCLNYRNEDRGQADDIKDVQSWKLLLSWAMKFLTRNPLPMQNSKSD